VVHGDSNKLTASVSLCGAGVLPSGIHAANSEGLLPLPTFPSPGLVPSLPPAAIEAHRQILEGLAEAVVGGGSKGELCSSGLMLPPPPKYKLSPHLSPSLALALQVGRCALLPLACAELGLPG
jgi:hypothetical protein